VAALMAILGLFVVFVFHFGQGFSNLYSLHSWIGLLTVILFEGNFLVGFWVFYYGKCPPWIRSLVLPYHTFLGVSMIALIVGSFITGLSEKALFVKYGDGLVYSDLPPQALIINILGVAIVIWGLICALLVTQRV